MFVTGNIEGISHSSTWKAYSHGTEERIQPQRPTFDLWNDRKDSLGIKGLTNS